MIYIGTCGFSRSRKLYYSTFNVVELQETFYNVPGIDRAIKLRNEAPRDFEFSLKVWQVITHPHNSPTWKRLKTKLPGSLNNYGYLKPTEENFRAWEVFREFALKINASFIVFQTPPSLPLNSGMLQLFREFFSSIKFDDFIVGWEFRFVPGKVDRKVLDDLCVLMQDFGIVHVTDILKDKPCYVANVIYTRLHGLNGYINYKYRYRDEDLVNLAKTIAGMEVGKIYILFNNVYMFDDAKRFKEIIYRYLKTGMDRE
jgi:uncharacterized protein YecE (DUF72 family)